jgi:hypothetical protein
MVVQKLNIVQKYHCARKYLHCLQFRAIRDAWLEEILKRKEKLALVDLLV